LGYPKTKVLKIIGIFRSTYCYRVNKKAAQKK